MKKLSDSTLSHLNRNALVKTIKELYAIRDEAIEYIENNSSKYDRTGDGYTFLDEDEIKPLLDILQGNKENK